MEIPVIWWVLLGLVLALLLASFCVARLLQKVISLNHTLRSERVKKGQMAEQFLPLITSYPWDPQNFRFIGSPIDGVQFEDDRVIFVEFKSGSSQLSAKQIRIRELVKAGKVDFREVRLKISRGAFQELQVR